MTECFSPAVKASAFPPCILECPTQEFQKKIPLPFLVKQQNATATSRRRIFFFVLITRLRKI